MKKKIVLWGQDKDDKKILIGLELQEKENKVLLHKFSENDATEPFYKQMMDAWREDKEVEFPASHEVEERPLSLTEDLLPETIRTDRTDLISRAKAEWHFVVLSSKLYDLYESEAEELKEKVSNLSKYDDVVWDEMKSFWAKVQDQVRDRNLFREHANSLRKNTNALFDTMKKMKNDLQKEFKQQSKQSYAEFTSTLDNIQEKLDKNLGLKPIFEELKSIQNDFKDAKFTREDRTKLWNRLDGYFKQVKERQFGDKGGNNTPLQRVQRRYDGLLNAIKKMEQSIARDKVDIERQEIRNDTTNGQLEKELGKAKMMMIEKRMESKNEKLEDMLKTKTQLLSKIEKEKKNEERRAKEAEITKAKVAAKEKIAKEMKEASKEVDKEKVEKIASEVNSARKPKAVKATPPPVELPKDEEE
jgi:septal ring factor EnvC (AmiA/AmiB activator)